MKPLLLLLAVGLVGCSARKISVDPKTKVMQYESHRFADKEQIGDIDVVFPDGTRLKVHNYSGNSVDGAKAIAEGAAQGVVAGLTGNAGAFKLIPKDLPSQPQPEIQ